MALEPPLWAAGPTGSLFQHSALLDRRLLNAVFASPGGALHEDDLVVTQRGLGANMSVDISAGSCIIPGTSVSNQGKYLCRSTAMENRAVATAPGSGTRTDIVIARAADSEVSGVSDGFLLEVLTGTTTVPNDAIGLARITVASGTASITNAMIADIRSQGRLRDRLLRNVIVTDPAIGGHIANKAYVDWRAAGVESGSFSMLTSGSQTGNSYINVPSGLVGNYIELIIRGYLTGSGEVGCSIDAGTGNLGFDWAYTTFAGNSSIATYQGTGDTSIIVGRWSTLLSVSTIRVYFSGNPTTFSTFRMEATSSRHSNTTSLRWNSIHQGRALTGGVIQRLYVASRGAGWGSFTWQLNGFRA